MAHYEQKFLGAMPAILGVDIMYHAVALNSLSQDY